MTLVLLEAGFRLAGVSVGTVQINRATVRRSDDPRLGFELRPGSVVRAEVEYRVNADGLRGPETTVEKPAGVRRVAVLGDSIAFGYWVAEKDGFPRQLEAMLNEAAGKAGRVEVLDFGVPGYNLDQEIEALRTRGLAFSPDLVIVAFCLNDLEGLFSYELGLVQDRAVRGRSWIGRLREGLLGRSLLFSWIEYRFSELEARRSFVRAKNPLEGPLYAEAVNQQRTALEGKLAVLGPSSPPAASPAWWWCSRCSGRASSATRTASSTGRSSKRRRARGSRGWTCSTATRPTTSATCAWTSCTRARSGTGWRRTPSGTACARGDGSARHRPRDRPAPPTGGRTSRRCAATSGRSGRNPAFAAVLELKRSSLPSEERT